MGRNVYAQPRSRPPRRLVDPFTTGVGTLGVGTTLAASTTYWVAVAIAGAVTVRVRAKTTIACNIDFFFPGPDFQVDQQTTTTQAGTPFANIIGTLYTTPAITTMAMVANTENKTDITPAGEGFLILKLSGAAGAGAITFLDVAQISYVG